jgi:hypothetical protein
MHGTALVLAPGAGGHWVEPEFNDDRTTARGGLRIANAVAVAVASGRQSIMKTRRRRHATGNTSACILCTNLSATTAAATTTRTRQ